MAPELVGLHCCKEIEAQRPVLLVLRFSSYTNYPSSRGTDCRRSFKRAGWFHVSTLPTIAEADRRVLDSFSFAEAHVHFHVCWTTGAVGGRIVQTSGHVFLFSALGIGVLQASVWLNKIFRQFQLGPKSLRSAI